MRRAKLHVSDNADFRGTWPIRLKLVIIPISRLNDVFVWTPSLIHLQPALLLAPTEGRLLNDTGFSHARDVVCHSLRYFDVPQQIYHLLRLVLLAFSQIAIPVQCLSYPLAHFEPGTPTHRAFTAIHLLWRAYL